MLKISKSGHFLDIQRHTIIIGAPVGAKKYWTCQQAKQKEKKKKDKEEKSIYFSKTCQHYKQIKANFFRKDNKEKEKIFQ